MKRCKLCRRRQENSEFRYKHLGLTCRECVYDHGLPEEETIIITPKETPLKESLVEVKLKPKPKQEKRKKKTLGPRQPRYLRKKYPSKLINKQYSTLFRYRTRADKKNLQWLLTDEQFINLIEGDCTYCGSAGGTINRIDSSLGYTMDNAVSCCVMCSRMKLDLSIDDWCQHMEKVLTKQSTEISKSYPQS